MPSNLPPGCTPYDYESRPGRDSHEKRTPENDTSLEYCENCRAICDASDLAWSAEFEFKGCPSCLSQCAAALAIEAGIDLETGCTPDEMLAPIPVLEPITSEVASLAGIPEFAAALASIEGVA